LVLTGHHLNLGIVLMVGAFVGVSGRVVFDGFETTVEILV
jgi:hypothetical protein